MKENSLDNLQEVLELCFNQQDTMMPSKGHRRTRSFNAGTTPAADDKTSELESLYNNFNFNQDHQNLFVIEE